MTEKIKLRQLIDDRKHTESREKHYIGDTVQTLGHIKTYFQLNKECNSRALNHNITRAFPTMKISLYW